MNRRQAVALGVGSAALVVLFVALWPLSAPIRQRRQLEDQAAAQLQGVTTASGSRFERIHISRLNYETEYEWYDVQYAIEWTSASGTDFTTNSSGSLRRSGKRFSGPCWIPSGGAAGESRNFILSVDEPS